MAAGSNSTASAPLCRATSPPAKRSATTSRYLTLVQEGVGWFDEQGCPALIIPVSIE
jgi:hypothetical protein